MNDLVDLSVITVCNPTADFQDFKYEPVTNIPKRPASLEGMRIELLPNWKNGLKPFMRILADRFKSDTKVKNAVYRDTGWLFTHPDKVEKIGPDADKLARDCDLMVSGVGDCGGCTLWSVKACIEFEKRGVPASVIVTDVFEHRAHQLLTSLGYPHIPVLVVKNPVIYLTEPEIHQRIDGLLDKLAASLCNKSN
jgi:hypothetical protein